MDLQQQGWNDYYAGMQNVKVKYDDWLDAYSEILNKSKNISIVDLGCGMGNNTGYLLEKSFNVISCDYSSEAINIVISRFPGAETRLFDMRSGLPFNNDSVYVIIADLSIHYFDWITTRNAVQEIYRVLKNDGTLLCRVNSTKDINHGAGKGMEIERNFYYNDGKYKRFFDLKQIEELFDCGWIKVGIEEKIINRFDKEKQLWEIVLKKI